MIKLTLLSRAYCHLCDDMEVALASVLAEFEAEVNVVDVDTDPLLEARYDVRVPVLLHGDIELCNYLLDTTKVRDYLSKIG